MPLLGEESAVPALWRPLFEQYRASSNVDGRLHACRQAATLLDRATSMDVRWLIRALETPGQTTFAECLLRYAPSAPEALFQPLVRAAVYVPNTQEGQFDRLFVELGTKFFGLEGVTRSLLEYVRDGSAFETVEALNALRWVHPTGRLKQEHDIVCLRKFVGSPDADMRRRLIGRFSLEPSDYPAELWSVVEHAIGLSKDNPDLRPIAEDLLEFHRLVRNPGHWSQPVSEFLNTCAGVAACQKAGKLLLQASNEDIRWLVKALGVDHARLKVFPASTVCQAPDDALRLWQSSQELLSALTWAAVHEYDPSFNRLYVDAAVKLVGPERTTKTLLLYVRQGTDDEVIGAVNALYWARWGGGCADPTEALLTCFIERTSARVRRALITQIPLSLETCPPEVRDLVQRASATAFRDSDPYVRERAQMQCTRIVPPRWRIRADGGFDPEEVTFEIHLDEGSIWIAGEGPRSSPKVAVIPFDRSKGGRVTWNGLDLAGARVAPGMYRVEVKAGSTEAEGYFRFEIVKDPPAHAQ